MTPKEEAKQLVDIYLSLVTEHPNTKLALTTLQAKDCALICVNKMMEEARKSYEDLSASLTSISYSGTDDILCTQEQLDEIIKGNFERTDRYYHLKEVKQEIEKYDTHRKHAA